MDPNSWKLGVDSNVSWVYVEPLFPEKGEQVVIRIQTGATDRVHTVRLVSFQLGREKQIVLHKVRQSPFSLYEGSVKVLDDPIYWYFMIQAEDRAYSYSTAGLKASVPPLRECFSLRPGLQDVPWVGGAICYQIFPDRFKKGGSHTGAIPGEYSFDGGIVTVHSFDEQPLEYESGRCLDFFNGDLAGIEDSLDHFKKLSVDTLYLNPIGRARTTHRYDCTDFFHVDEKLGGDEAFEHLCNTLHAQGMKIIIDISINHTGTEHPWYKKALSDPHSEEASYYYFNEDGSVACWQDVPTLPQLNYTSEALRDHIYRAPDSVMRSFLKPPYLQDGWRLDVSSEVGRRGDDQLCEEIWREVRLAVKEENPQAYLVGEDWVDSTPFLQGDMWDATMNYLGSSRPMRSWMGETDRYMTDGWGHQPAKTRPFTGDEFAQALQSHLTGMPGQMLGMQMNLINSHDTPRLYNNTELFNWPLYRGLVRLLYLLPGMPNIYYGEEIALAGPYGTVERARYPMQWDENVWDHDFFALYTELGEMRKTYADTLKRGGWAVVASDEHTLTFARYDAALAIVCILSRAETDVTVTFSNAMLCLSTLIEGMKQQVQISTEEVQVALAPCESILFVAKR